MKTLHLIRHAKAVAPLGVGNEGDIARRLHPAAVTQVCNLSAQLHKESYFCPDKLYYSTAVRCAETVQLMADYALCQDVNLTPDADLYDADATELLEFIQSEDDNLAEIAIVGHNPALQQLALALVEPSSNQASIDHIVNLSQDFPTMGYVEFCFDAHRWQDINISTGVLQQFICPKIGRVPDSIPVFGSQEGPMSRMPIAG